MRLFAAGHLFAAIHLFTRSVTKSKISTSPVKKLVGNTNGVQKLKAINGYTCVFIYTPGVGM